VALLDFRDRRPGSQFTFGTWDFIISRYSVYSRPDRPGKRLKQDFYFVVFVFSFCFQVEIALCLVAEGFEKVEKHFCRHPTDFSPLEGGIPDQPGPSAKINCGLGQAVVHGEDSEAIAFDTAFVAEGNSECFAECERGIFYGMMFINMQVAIHVHLKVTPGMFGELVEHVVEEADTGIILRTALPVEIETDTDFGFPGDAVYGCCT
jgi:hypothetical protein